MAQLQKGTIYSPVNATVTVDNLNAHVDNAQLLSGAISEQAALSGPGTPASDQVLLLNGGNLKKATVVQALGNITPSELLNRNNNLSDLVNATTARSNLGLGNVENKSSETIRSEITLANVTAALTYLPTSPTQLSTGLDGRIATSQQSSFATTAQLSSLVATSQLGAINGVAQLGADGKLESNQIAALTTAAQLALIGTTALPVIGAQPLLTLPLPTSQGGTGQSTFANGQLLIGNGAGLTKATLTAGANIDITNGAGSISLAVNAILPKAIVNFSGQLADAVTITCPYEKIGNAFLVDYSLAGGKPALAIGNRIYFTSFTGGANAPTSTYYTVESFSFKDNGAVQVLQFTSAVAGNALGNAVFKECLVHYKQFINNVVLVDPASSDLTLSYIVNLNSSLSGKIFGPVVSGNTLASNVSPIGSATGVVAMLDYTGVDGDNLRIARTSTSFVFSGSYDPIGGSPSVRPMGYFTNVVVYTN
jgi:hypothetical protein